MAERRGQRTKGLPFVASRRGGARFPDPGDRVTLADGRTARLERVDCCLCRTADDEPLIAVADWRYHLTRDLFAIVRCRRCRLAYLNPRPVLEDMALFYPDRYYARRRPGEADAPPMARRVGEAALAEQEAACGTPPSGAAPPRLLDVGCASGAFLSRMRDRGWRVKGVEVSLEAAAWGVRELGLDIVNSPLAQAGLPDASFDVVTFWSSLEHVHDPVACLAAARAALELSGRAVILIPNLASPTVRYLHWGLDPPRHLYHFTPATLTRALRAAGFEGPIAVRSRTRIEDGSLHRQVAKIGRRLKRHYGRGPAAFAGRALSALSPALAPVSWALTLAGRNGAMIVTALKSPLR